MPDGKRIDIAKRASDRMKGFIRAGNCVGCRMDLLHVFARERIPRLRDLQDAPGTKGLAVEQPVQA